MFVLVCSFFSSKITRNRLSAGLRPNPLHGGAYSAAPDPLAGLRGLLLKSGEEKYGNGGEKRKRWMRLDGMGQEGKGREGLPQNENHGYGPD